MAHATTTTAPDQDVWNGGVSPMNASYGKLMMWFFLLSDAFTFSALLVTYGLVRSAHKGYEGLVDAFKFSTEHWPIPEKVFEAVPFLHGMELPLVFVG
ncbi:MAG: cytochrome oxidase subunit III, partial [Flammeovirgaceae bacterium]